MIKLISMLFGSFMKYLKSEKGTLDTSTGLVTFDITGGVRVDFTPMLAAMLVADTKLLGRIPVGQPVANTTHKWVERSLTPLEVAGVGALTVDGVTLTLTAAHVLRVRVGALLKDFAKGKTEVVQVTAIASTTTLTITRGYGTTTGQTHLTGATWKIVAQPRQEGQDSDNGGIGDSSEAYNYTQIFERDLKLSRTIEQISKAGTLVGISDMEKQAMLEKTLSVKQELEFSVINGIKSASAGSDTVFRTMSGLIEYLDVADSNRNVTSESISYKVVNDLVKAISDDGGSPNLIVTSAALHRTISTWDSEKIAKIQADRMAGSFITRVLTDLGSELEIININTLPDDVLMVLDTKRLILRPLLGSGWIYEPLAKTGDARKAQVVGEWTLEVHNATEAHAIHRNLNPT